MKRSFFRCCAAVTLLSIGMSLSSSAQTEDLASIVNLARQRYAVVSNYLKDLTVVQSTKVTNRQKDAVSSTADMVVYKKGDRLRIETSPAVPPGQQQKGAAADIGKSIIIYDGKNAWRINPLLGKTKIANDDPSLLQTQQKWWDTLSKNAELNGTEVIQGRQAYIINNRDKSAAFARLWLDREKLVPLQIEVIRDNTKLRTLFSDYQNVKNITELPYRIDIFQNDAPVSETTVRSVEVNTGLPDTLFDAGAVKATDTENNLLKGPSQDK
jgi:outer membrane lipoprotein-sorting protein